MVYSDLVIQEIISRRWHTVLTTTSEWKWEENRLNNRTDVVLIQYADDTQLHLAFVPKTHPPDCPFPITQPQPSIHVQVSSINRPITFVGIFRQILNKAQILNFVCRVCWCHSRVLCPEGSKRFITTMLEPCSMRSWLYSNLCCPRRCKTGWDCEH